MSLPNLFVPGAAKSGTSSLHTYLSQHPQIFMSAGKEPQFFSREDRFKCGITEYEKLFEGAEGYAFRGESSTTYMVSRKTIERISAFIDEPRFIFVLRNPIDRAYSHYWWLRGQGFETRSFREAILGDMHLEPDPNVDIKRNGVYRSYFEFGRYAKWIGLYEAAFGQEAIHIVLTEQMRNQPLETINSCFSFLQLPLLPILNTVQSNRTIILKSAGIYQWLLNFGRHNGLNHLIRKVLPTKGQTTLLGIRTHILLMLKDRLRSDNKYPSIQFDDRQWLQELYAAEVNGLRQITQQPFYEWKSDFPLSEQGAELVYDYRKVQAKVLSK